MGYDPDSDDYREALRRDHAEASGERMHPSGKYFSEMKSARKGWYSHKPCKKPGRK